MFTRFIFLLLFLSISIVLTQAQTVSIKSLSRKEVPPQNTSKEHRWWNLLHYTISVTPDFNARFILGSNNIEFVALEKGQVIRIDLQEPMRITAVDYNSAVVTFKKEKNYYLITLPKEMQAGETGSITIYFQGHPTVALKPPFDSGWIWTKDEQGRPWMSIACQGSGASIWLPCKEVLYDEPEKGVSFSITVADTLTAIANGRLLNKLPNKNGTTTYTWAVINPINNYNIIPYIGKYVTWQKTYPGKKGKLDCSYWVLDYNLEKAKKHFEQADTMLRCFEYWLGPYPFYEDSYKLVEAPMPGMEHQSAIAYGNGFKNGYHGTSSISGTVWGLKWDFILIHESGHEWFGNSITSANHGESWIHEGFTKYLETLYTSYVFGKEAGNDYATGTWKRIKNDQPPLGNGTSDNYYKGSAMLHMIRQVIGDEVFRAWLQQLGIEFYQQTVSTQQILNSLNRHTGKNFTRVFDQYLKTTQVPVLEYFIQNKILNFRWTNCVDGFSMPVKILSQGRGYLINPTTSWQKRSVSLAAGSKIMPDRNFYVNIKEVRN